MSRSIGCEEVVVDETWRASELDGQVEADSVARRLSSLEHS